MVEGDVIDAASVVGGVDGCVFFSSWRRKRAFPSIYVTLMMFLKKALQEGRENRAALLRPPAAEIYANHLQDGVHV